MVNDDVIRSWMSLSKSGPVFASYAAQELLQAIGLRNGLNHDVCYYMLRSAIVRQDIRNVSNYLQDWGGRYRTCAITKFSPGKHWYALNERFNSHAEAVEYASSKGYKVSGVKEKRFPHAGD